MRFRERATEEVDINLTPLIDVVFLLLIFFMVTTTFNRQAALKVDLPEATAAALEQPDDRLELVIDREGRYYLNGSPLVNTQAKTLVAALRQAAQGRTELPMVIRADARTPHQAVVTAMDSAARIGLTRLSIATSKSGGQD